MTDFYAHVLQFLAHLIEICITGYSSEVYYHNVALPA